MKQTVRTALLASTLIMGIATPAVAQVAPAADSTAQQPEVNDSEQEITVTGSRIPRPNLESSNPVSVIGTEEIGFRQPTSVEALLRDLPGAVPNIGPGVNNGSNGSAQLDIRGLGPNRNLILIDGQRTVPASLGGVTDLNIIPIALLQRIETLTGGASVAYGADAVAGVTNFITRTDFSGVDIGLNSGITERGDGFNMRADLTLGANLADNRGNVVLSLGYTKADAIQQGERPYGRASLSSVTGRPQGSGTATPASILAPFTGRVNAQGTAFEVGPLSDYNFNPLNVYQTPFERYNIFGKANYEISDAVEVFAQGFFTKTIVDQIIAPSGTFFSNVQLPLSNPYLTQAMRNQLCASSNINAVDCAAASAATSTTAPGYREITASIGRRFTEAGPRTTSFETNTFQVQGGARGALTSTLDWNITGIYGESERTNTSQGQGTLPRLQQALRAFNTTACTVTTGNCVPINLFGTEGTLTPAMFNFLNVTTFNFIQTSFTSLQGTVAGDLGFSSPFAAENIGVAVGVEYRRYAGSSGGDGISSQPGAVLGAGAPALPITGEYDTREVFGELNVPLISDRPFFDSLTLEGGFRYSDYSLSGGNWAYRGGLTWAPVSELKLRGSYARAVRAPNLGELFQPQVTFLTNRAIDPCQGAVTNQGVSALCAAQLALVGAPASLLGNIPAPVAGQINATQGGNLGLTPEYADTFTVGGVLQPKLFDGFALTVDYYKIKVTDAISTPSQADIIDGCFNGTNAAACDLIRRNPLTGGLSGPNDTTFGPFLGLSNLGTIRTSGIDVGASLRQELGFARLDLNFLGNYTFDSQFQATPTSVNRDCVGLYSVSCASIQPEYSWNLRGTLSFEGGTVTSLRWKHLSESNVEPASSGGPASVFAAYRRIPAFNYLDLTLQQAVGDTMTFTFTVTNLLDKDPPIVGNTIGSTAFNSGNTYPSTYDPIGRRFNVGVNLRF